MKLGRLYVDNLDLSSCCSIFSAKISFSVIIDFVSDMVIDAKRVMRLNIPGMPFIFLSFSLIVFLRLNPQIWRFTYSGLGGRTVKERCVLLHLVKASFLHLG